MRSISLLFLSMVLFLSGCSSVFYAKTQMPVQTEQDIAKIKNPASVKIERENNPWGGATPFVVYDGKKEIGRLGPSGAFEWKREAGYLKLTITGVPVAITGNAVPDEVIYEDCIEAGDTYGFLIGTVFPDDTWAISIKPQQEQAPEDIVAFGRAEYSNTVESYERFVTSHAESTKADEAIRRYENLIEEAGILNIDNLNNKNIEILKGYLKALPGGKHAQFAKEVNQYYEAERKPSKEAFEDYLEKWPNGRFEKWAKDNLVSTSLGEVKDPSVINTQEAAREIAREGILKTLKSLKEGAIPVFSNSSGLSSFGTLEKGFAQLNTLGVIEGQAVWFKGTLGFSKGGTDRYSFYYNGNASNELTGGSIKRTFILKYDVLTRPLSVDSSEISLLEKSWILVDGKQYPYNGRHWVHGLHNPFFPIDK